LIVMVSSRAHLSPERRNSRPAAVLLVEDEILLRAAVAEYLRKLGYAVVEAADAPEAIAAFSSGEPIDVVLCDVDLPGIMDGLNLALWINRLRSAPPVLLTSGRGLRASAGERTAFSFIAKPYRLAALTERLELLLASGGSSADERSEPEPS
jgi:DNA-binding response OmpR family regulator